MPKTGGDFPKFMPSSSSSNVLHNEADITEFFTATEFYSHNHCHWEEIPPSFFPSLYFSISLCPSTSPAPKCPNFMGVHEVFVKMPQSPPSSLLHDTDHRSIARFIGYALCQDANWLPTA
ncbi:unnamed protein product [Ilex paraguariensis]|uniref:Uncharacterized protein n=1 Tax=Ilex paraguariensis TaxID=185542 RepID=A0ABC8RXQ8_9AQUA